MRELFRFIQRIHFFLLFLLLEIIAFSFLVSNNSYQRAKFFNSSNFIIGHVYDSYSLMADYIYLNHKNEELLKENARLRYQSDKLDYLLEKNNSDSVFSKPYSYIPARVINNSVKQHKNYITINKGENDSVQAEMGVVSPSGVVGITRFTSNNFTSVVSVLNNEIRISTKIKRLGYFGPLAWKGVDASEAFLMEIPVHVSISIGDTLVTSGYSTIFPEGILIGTIKEYEKKPGDNFYQIKVKLSVDFFKLGNVYIIKNHFKNEQLELEKATTDD
ncbi:MAG: rod shape-determining protein MreC [Bacteroidota bacterium]|nr:rod shape-determining protein MreC [Bacteroidota bacterium]